jgi:hypothetical protein
VGGKRELHPLDTVCVRDIRDAQLLACQCAKHELCFCESLPDSHQRLSC